NCTPGTSLPDPWYGPADGFEDTLDAIEDAMPGIVDEVRSLA
ncbi:MAG: low molecular weight phosphotyrosine protein phosphatase, partial [Cutibacterium avidum]|nr:low molecular weight phosphotyrosine protein phosphatase [Cutibacterium avidum]